MKVFISWSGEISHKMAQALADWLPNVIQAVKPFLSSEDIQKGARWFNEIGGQLADTNFGVLCLTRANLTAPWILFEAGALSKQLSVARVVPLLIDLKPADLTPPLSQFNAVSAPTKDEMEKLLKAMNGALADDKLTEQQLSKAFAREWPELEARVKAIEEAAQRAPQAAQPRRSTHDMIEEILELTRAAARRPTGSLMSSPSILFSNDVSSRPGNHDVDLLVHHDAKTGKLTTLELNKPQGGTTNLRDLMRSDYVKSVLKPTESKE
jgi:hypothetical protein